jgi:6-phosphofructo-2-kinase/fructose-2,6-biphosphatase
MYSEELKPEERNNLVVWTSNMKRAKQTAAEIHAKKKVEWRALREIEVGICDGLSYDQMKVKFPEEHRSRQQDKLKYRYPRGESYLDVITRLEVRPINIS